MARRAARHGASAFEQAALPATSFRRPTSRTARSGRCLQSRINHIEGLGEALLPGREPSQPGAQGRSDPFPVKRVNLIPPVSKTKTVVFKRRVKAAIEHKVIRGYRLLGRRHSEVATVCRYEQERAVRHESFRHGLDLALPPLLAVKNRPRREGSASRRDQSDAVRTPTRLRRRARLLASS